MEFQKVNCGGGGCGGCGGCGGGGGGDSPPSPPSLKLSNGYVLPQGTLTPNTLFVGGIALKVDVDEIRNFFLRFGAIRDVKIINHKGGICKGYGFVYFSEEVDIQTIVEQQVSFKGRKLKLGPAIMKERNSYHSSPRPAPWTSPAPYVYCTYCSQGLSVPHVMPWIGGGNPYPQPYTYPCGPGGYVFPQMPPAYAPNAYPYPYAPPLWDGGDHSTQPVNRSCPATSDHGSSLTPTPAAGFIPAFSGFGDPILEHTRTHWQQQQQQQQQQQPPYTGIICT